MSNYHLNCNILFMTVIDLSKPYDNTLPFTSEMWLKVNEKFISVINRWSFNTFKLSSFDGMIYHDLINIYWNGSYFFCSLLGLVYPNFTTITILYVCIAMNMTGVMDSTKVRLLMFSDTFVQRILNKGKQWEEQYLTFFLYIYKTISKFL